MYDLSLSDCKWKTFTVQNTHKHTVNPIHTKDAVAVEKHSSLISSNVNILISQHPPLTFSSARSFPPCTLRVKWEVWLHVVRNSFTFIVDMRSASHSGGKMVPVVVVLVFEKQNLHIVCHSDSGMFYFWFIYKFESSIFLCNFLEHY